MRIGLYGGSFDPIHRGHIEPVVEASRGLDLDQVLYLPTASPPHKPDRDMTPAHHRLAMTELALLDQIRFDVSSFEMERHPAYTIDTVEHFLGSRSGDHLFLVVGADSFLGLHSWRRGDELAAVVELIVLSRPGWRLEDQELPAPQRRAVELGRVHPVSESQVAASSTRIRRLLAAGEPLPDGWLDPRVLDYIRQHRLYRA